MFEGSLLITGSGQVLHHGGDAFIKVSDGFGFLSAFFKLRAFIRVHNVPFPIKKTP